MDAPAAPIAPRTALIADEECLSILLMCGNPNAVGLQQFLVAAYKTNPALVPFLGGPECVAKTIVTYVHYSTANRLFRAWRDWCSRE